MDKKQQLIKAAEEFLEGLEESDSTFKTKIVEILEGYNRRLEELEAKVAKLEKPENNA